MSAKTKETKEVKKPFVRKPIQLYDSIHIRLRELFEEVEELIQGDNPEGLSELEQGALTKRNKLVYKLLSDYKKRYQG